MHEGNHIRQSRLRCIQSAGQMPSPAINRDIEYEKAANNRIAIELHFHNEMTKAALQYRAKVLWIFAWVTVAIIGGAVAIAVAFINAS